MTIWADIWADIWQDIWSDSIATNAKTLTDWIIQQPGLTGPIPDRWNQYLRGLGYSGTLPDMFYAWFTGLGYTQNNLQDKYAAWAASTLIN